MMNATIKSRKFWETRYWLFFLSVCIIVPAFSSDATAEQIVLKAAYYQPGGHQITELGR